MEFYTTTSQEKKENFLKNDVSRFLISLTVILAIIYLYAMMFIFPRGNFYLFVFLVLGQAYQLFQIITFAHTIWDTNYEAKGDRNFFAPVDVLIPVSIEPREIISQTVKAASEMDYPSFKIYLLNDAYVMGKENWREIEKLAEELGVECITRTKAGGAKAGNINNAVKQTTAPFIAVFDSDHIPHQDFLRELMAHFGDSKVAFVQAPQYYRNQEESYITEAAWQQQLLFFGPICKGKNRLNSAPMCGTNMIIRRTALAEVGGICDTNIAEDFITGFFLHQRGWKSVYVPKVLAEGMAPEDFLSYCKQQFRWARGSLEVLFKYNPFFKRGFTWTQRFQYVSSASYYVSGVIVLLNALIPVIFFYTGLVPFVISTMGLALIFIPYFIVVIYMLQCSTNFTYTFRALAFSIASFPIHIKAVFAVLTNQKSVFVVTPKNKISGNFLSLVIPHVVYICIVFFGLGIAIAREGISPSVVTNIAWVTFNIATFIPFIMAAAPQELWSAESLVKKRREISLVR